MRTLIRITIADDAARLSQIITVCQLFIYNRTNEALNPAMCNPPDPERERLVKIIESERAKSSAIRSESNHLYGITGGALMLWFLLSEKPSMFLLSGAVLMAFIAIFSKRH